jgi:hypothetical protein
MAACDFNCQLTVQVPGKAVSYPVRLRIDLYPDRDEQTRSHGLLLDLLFASEGRNKDVSIARCSTSRGNSLWPHSGIPHIVGFRTRRSHGCDAVPRWPFSQPTPSFLPFPLPLLPPCLCDGRLHLLRVQCCLLLIHALILVLVRRSLNLGVVDGPPHWSTRSREQFRYIPHRSGAARCIPASKCIARLCHAETILRSSSDHEWLDKGTHTGAKSARVRGVPPKRGRSFCLRIQLWLSWRRDEKWQGSRWMIEGEPIGIRLRQAGRRAVGDLMAQVGG